MVPTLAQYQYVEGADVDADHPHGDLDRILWDGEVMPLRTGNTESVDRNGDPIPRKKIMRGEDIAFLMEAYVERLHLGNFVPAVSSPSTIPNETFSRKLDAGQLTSNYPRNRPLPGFNELGSRQNWWVPETGLPQTGVYEAPFTLSDAWPGLLTWPDRMPIRSQDWTPVTFTYPDYVHNIIDVLTCSHIEPMFENLKLMTSVSCQVCSDATFAGDSRFTSEHTYEKYDRNGDPISSQTTHTTFPGFTVLYDYHGLSGYYNYVWYLTGNNSTTTSLKTGGSAVVASNLLPGAKLTPVYVAHGTAYMDESLWNGAYIDPESSDQQPRGRLLDKDLYYCLVGSTVTVPATGEFTVDAETLIGLWSRLRGALAVDESFAVGVDNTYRRECRVSCTLQEVHLIVTLGDHTRWWE